VGDLTDTVSQLQRRVEYLEVTVRSVEKEQASRPVVPMQRTDLPVDPILAAEWEALGLAYLRIGDSAKAGEALYRAVALNPEDPVLHYNLGILCDDFFETPVQALRHYRKFLALAPEDPDAFRVREWVSKIEGKEPRS
jgi:Flp pilus assembly protein TadD